MESVSFQVWMHVLWDTTASTHVSTVATRSSVRAVWAMSWIWTRRHAHVRHFLSVSFVLLPLWGSGPLWFPTMDQELMCHFSFWTNSPSTLVTNYLCLVFVFCVSLNHQHFLHNCILTTYIAINDTTIRKVRYIGHTCVSRTLTLTCPIIMWGKKPSGKKPRGPLAVGIRQRQLDMWLLLHRVRCVLPGTQLPAYLCQQWRLVYLQVPRGLLLEHRPENMLTYELSVCVCGWSKNGQVITFDSYDAIAS